MGFVDQPKFPEMAGQMAVLEVGGVSSVFKGPDGFYIIKLEETKGGEPLSFDQVKEDIQSGLTLLKQQQAILKYIEDLKLKMKVETNESLLQQ